MEKRSIHGDKNGLWDKPEEEVRGVDFGKCKKKGGLTPPPRKLVKRMALEKIANAVASAFITTITPITPINNADSAVEADMQNGGGGGDIHEAWPKQLTGSSSLTSLCCAISVRI
ncbi:hypothetical protein CDL15_Pgr012682 [Punica granatum]|uniref:Uncharacterized protein n=1 Tax=Punica granatum TaxID=22663 RepID=A0A218XV55_PUNGR|nr:hypothetical protein CDL15_Pgr012682 [Punica granatum]